MVALPFSSFIHNRLHFTRINQPRLPLRERNGSSSRRCFLFNRFLISRVSVAMARKRNRAPESSQRAFEIFAFGRKAFFGSTRHQQLEAEKKALTRRLYYAVSLPFTTPFKIISRPACIDEDGGSSGPAIFDSISALPAFHYDRYESCITIAGADYCVIAVDFNPGQLKFSKLSSKCVMASCGFQDDVKALQEALSAANLVCGGIGFGSDISSICGFTDQ